MLETFNLCVLFYSDTTLYPQNFWEDIKQWTNVFGVSQTPTSNLTNNPLPGYSRASFGPNVQAILAQGVGHTVPERAGDVLDWFSLTNLTPGNPVTTTSSTSSSSTSTSSSAPTPSGTGVAAHWDQCGGIGWIGPTGKLTAFNFEFVHSSAVSLCNRIYMHGAQSILFTMSIIRREI